MAKTSRKYTDPVKDLPLEDDYENFGYDIQNAKRYSTRNKRQTKFKDYDDYGEWIKYFKGGISPSFFIHIHKGIHSTFRCPCLYDTVTLRQVA